MSFTLLAPAPLIQTVTELPNPLFGDGEGSTGELNILRTVGGKRRTYIKTKDRRKLRWEFRLTRNKAMEFLEFYRSYNAHRIFVIDHNNRSWSGHIVNNPFEVEMTRRGGPAVQGWPVGETCSVTIEFEGMQSDVTAGDGIDTGSKIFAETANSTIGPMRQSIVSEFDLPVFGSLLHNWDANTITHTDGNRLYSWSDSGPASNDLVGTVGGLFDCCIDRAPVYRKASVVFNLRPTVAFEEVRSSLTINIAAMQTTSNTTFFPGKRGTVFWVFSHTANTNYQNYLSSGNPSLLEAAFADTSFNTPIESGLWSLQRKTLTSEVEQIHMSGSSSSRFPVNTRFQPNAIENDVRLIKSATDAVPSLQPFIYTLCRDSNTNLRFRTNGIEREGATINGHQGYTGLFHLNDQKFRPFSVSVMVGEWGQFLVYQKALTTSQMESVERYLSLRWGVPLLTAPF